MEVESLLHYDPLRTNVRRRSSNCLASMKSASTNAVPIPEERTQTELTRRDQITVPACPTTLRLPRCPLKMLLHSHETLVIRGAGPFESFVPIKSLLLIGERWHRLLTIDTNSFTTISRAKGYSSNVEWNTSNIVTA